MNAPLSLESQLKWLAGAVAVAVGLLMPGLALFSSYQSRVGAMEGEVRIAAFAVTEFVNGNSGLWQFQNERLNAVLRRLVSDQHHARVITVEGQEVAGIGPEGSGFILSHDEVFHDFGKPVGRVVLSMSGWDIVRDALWMFLAGIGVGLLVYFPMRILPLRALRESTRALRESEERNRTVVAALSEGILMVDRSRQQLIVNEAAHTIFGDRLENWLSGRETSAYLRDPAGNPIPDADHPINKTFSSRLALNHEVFQLERAGGGRIWILVNTQALLDQADGEVSAVVASVVDIDEERRREEDLMRAREAADAASLAKSQFLANMSHEIRTPMNGILGMAELLATDPELSEEQRDFVNTIQSSGESLLNVINDILDFSKVEAGHLRLDARGFDLRERVETTIKLQEARARAKGLELTLSIANAVPTWVNGDPARLHQILANLVGNSIKFTSQGSVEVRVEPVANPCADGENCYLRFIVRDTGIGIAPEFMPRLFTHFAQADETNTRRFGGTGLGLAISRQLVELMGGEIGAESEPGKGAMFWFTVLLGRAEQPAVHEAPFSGAPSRSLAGRVLVVEDDPTNRMLAKVMLTVLGCEPVLAENGETALDWLARERCDLILMDNQMPGIDGFETTARIRAREAEMKDGSPRVPIIALTANALVGDRERCIAAGMDDYLSKPFTRHGLLDVLTRWLPSGENRGDLVEPTLRD